MRSKPVAIVAASLFLVSLFMISQRVLGQSNSAPRLITEVTDESRMLTLPGNVHPLARAQFMQGAAPASLPMDNIMMVLKRSAAQQSALDTLAAQQTDPSSPNYHNWLTPEEFGQRFGASDEDIAQVTTWLQSRGFQVAEVSTGRSIIQFSGNAGQVQAAFHTAINSYQVNGAQYWANESDPQIPAALAPAVTGVVSLHNFPKHAANHSLGAFRRNMKTAKAEALNPSFTFNGGCEENNCFALGPQDFATIYNITPLYTAGIDGSGETIAVIADSNINISDVTQFRSIFGLPAKNPTVIIPTGSTSPGINGDEVEAVLDVEWSGAVAKNASIDLVASASTNASFGGDLSASYVVNKNLAPIMSESFGQCELFLGSANNAFYNTLFQQAATQGITVVVSTGDSGSAGCLLNPPNSGNPNTFGLGVNGVGSTPFNVAVGGTDFDQVKNGAAFWNLTNTAGTQGSAKGYIPETTWNDSCTNLDFGTEFGFSTNQETNCNNTTQLADFISLDAGSGGVSNCTTPTGLTTSTCAGGYAKPSWQTGTGVPADGKRDLPDVSLFAATGAFSGSFYIICQADDPNFQNGAACNLTANNFSDFSGVGGTSVSTQVFAGIVALIDQEAKSAQGNINPKLYSLAAKQTGNCATAAVTAGNACVFYDVSKGTITQVCLKGGSNCTTNTSSDKNGVLTGYNAAAGYDLATGLGSMNVNNLVKGFSGSVVTPPTGSFTVGPASGTATVSAPGGSTTYGLTVTGTNGFAGPVTFTCSGLPAKAFCNAPAATLSASTTTATSTLTITTTASTAQLIPAPQTDPGNPGLTTMHLNTVALSMFATLAIFVTGMFAFAPKKKFQHSAAVFALMVFGLVFIASCGGGGGSTGGGTTGGTTGTPTGNSTVTVTATSGSTTSTTSFTLTVQ